LDVDGGVMGGRRLAWIVRRQVRIDRQPGVAMREVVVLGVDTELFIARAPARDGRR
jgi:hypothetical protein